MTIGVFKVTERSEVTIPKTPNSFFFFCSSFFFFLAFFTVTQQLAEFVC